MWNINRKSNVPLYQQISYELENKITNGELPPGSLLPSERKLAIQLGVNRSTIVLAYSELRSKGIVESIRGKGTQVNQIRIGQSNLHTPSWGTYVENGNILPNLPLLLRSRDAAQSPSIIDFASGKLSEDLVPTEEVNQILKEYSYLPNQGYDGLQGYLPLREALVSFLKEYKNIHVTAESILITTGTQQSLFLIAQSLLSPGDAIAVENPSFILSLPMFRSAGLRIYRVPTDENGICPEEISYFYRKYKVKMLFVNPNYQNPTGTTLSPSRKDVLLEIARELGLPIVEEDSYSLATFDNQQPSSLKASDSTTNILYIGSLSKIAAAGLRIGWVVAPQLVIKKLSDVRRQIDMGFNIIPQHIASRFIASHYFKPHIKKLTLNLSKKLDLTINALDKELSGLVDFRIPSGGLHVWCRVIPEIRDDKTLLEESIKRGVVFVPGSVYGAKQGFMRLTFARPNENEIDKGIARLASAIKASL
ncbi:DNA-binding transcriptional MocR family regulator [Cytobacillus firmus]|uniref:DNA-binding transcriptional MocR family regulator n=2 Tax=Cytobacillus TaxID=2675230 RepID=A0A366JIM7_CYTFI|nr:MULTISPECIES: PLP-dependent aminotransferase family protein [Cytobacillus]RBP86172.1 DNA-binding transcriptional MocR family regulator [Cytobacillus firmus]TDX36415.1 DNA-binding transcriptional MocR family regulator [Cytobacillus oceanisediminis]